MKIINWNDIVSSGRDFFQGQKTGITIGTFDGVHAGHKTLIDMCVSYSKLHNLVPLAVTFRFPPKKSLSPLDYPGEILPFACKINLLDKLGIRQVLVIDFSSEFGRMSGEDFVEILRNSLHFNYLAAGYDFRFGRSMESGVPELRIMAEKYHFVLEVASPVTVGGERVSSSLIRCKIRGGELGIVRRLLGRPFCIYLQNAAFSREQGKLKYALGQIKQVLPPAGEYKVSLSCGGENINPLLATGDGLTGNCRIDSGFLVLEDFDLDSNPCCISFI